MQEKHRVKTTQPYCGLSTGRQNSRKQIEPRIRRGNPPNILKPQKSLYADLHASLNGKSFKALHYVEEEELKSKHTPKITTARRRSIKPP
ncbi:hypothetical protein PAE0138 [Pyrobaculum aerophilum str. IM2]|uniref:Uncharacterized protein n=1 Tax=Pyrobaculum aerophilum (strain ATCC 51768 / DSM 7523 / JCM 9630 / CIP 104966 / NBRC 100827 / IM2) TaxID=178306 RepID=Q8ZZQ2_PYRAE|nr:hypothetical protein PAE0138 [Pyrobaculum aerophilum str. IM2]